MIVPSNARSARCPLAKIPEGVGPWHPGGWTVSRSNVVDAYMRIRKGGATSKEIGETIGPIPGPAPFYPRWAGGPPRVPDAGSRALDCVFMILKRCGLVRYDRARRVWVAT